MNRRPSTSGISVSISRRTSTSGNVPSSGPTPRPPSRPGRNPTYLSETATSIKRSSTIKLPDSKSGKDQNIGGEDSGHGSSTSSSGRRVLFSAASDFSTSTKSSRSSICGTGVLNTKLPASPLQKLNQAPATRGATTAIKRLSIGRLPATPSKSNSSRRPSSSGIPQPGSTSKLQRPNTIIRRPAAPKPFPFTSSINRRNTIATRLTTVPRTKPPSPTFSRTTKVGLHSANPICSSPPTTPTKKPSPVIPTFFGHCLTCRRTLEIYSSAYAIPLEIFPTTPVPGGPTRYSSSHGTDCEANPNPQLYLPMKQCYWKVCAACGKSNGSMMGRCWACGEELKGVVTQEWFLGEREWKEEVGRRLFGWTDWVAGGREGKKEADEEMEISRDE